MQGIRSGSLGGHAVRLTIHYDNLAGLARPHLRLWQADANTVDLAPTGGDEFGPLWELPLVPPELTFTFTAGPGAAQTDGHDRRVRPLVGADGGLDPGQVWCRGDRAFVYPVRPADPQPEPAAAFLERLAADPGFPAGLELPSAGGRSGFGANLLADGRVLFGLYHPTAARVFVAGSFNDWQYPGQQRPDPDAFVELALFRGWFGAANTWLAVTDRAGAGDEYRFWVQGGTPPEDAAGGRLVRRPATPASWGPTPSGSNAVVVDPTTFAWSDRGWRTPDPADLILYEVSVHGFTDGDPDIRPDQQGRFDGITERIRTGYFDSLGVTALSLMPLAEVPSMQGPTSHSATTRRCTTPSSATSAAPTTSAGWSTPPTAAASRSWSTRSSTTPATTSTRSGSLVLEQPDERRGGLYFNGATPWGNRVATEKADVQNLLIDACRMLVGEYHVDGFRLRRDPHRLHGPRLPAPAGRGAQAGQARRPPGGREPAQPGRPQPGRAATAIAQWSELFHDKLKAMLREGQFEGTRRPAPTGWATPSTSAAPASPPTPTTSSTTVESHDEHERRLRGLQFNPWLDNPAAKERKGRLGMFATLVALGQPMIYMGQEFNLERPRNVVSRRLAAQTSTSTASTSGPPADPPAPPLPGPAPARLRPGRRRPVRVDPRPLAGRAPRRRPPHGRLARRIPASSPTTPWSCCSTSRASTSRSTSSSACRASGSSWPTSTRSTTSPRRQQRRRRDPTALHSSDGRFAGFALPSSSGFIYKWAAP